MLEKTFRFVFQRELSAPFFHPFVIYIWAYLRKWILNERSQTRVETVLQWNWVGRSSNDVRSWFLSFPNCSMQKKEVCGLISSVWKPQYSKSYLVLIELEHHKDRAKHLFYNWNYDQVSLKIAFADLLARVFISEIEAQVQLIRMFAIFASPITLNSTLNLNFWQIFR